MGFWAKDGSYVREASDDIPKMTQGSELEAMERMNKGQQDWEAQVKAEKEAAKKAKIEYAEINKRAEENRMNAIEHERNQREAIRLIVDQKRQAYNNKSWFGKAIATMKGRNFANMRDKIEEDAIRRVGNMSPENLKEFIKVEEERGQSR